MENIHGGRARAIAIQKRHEPRRFALRPLAAGASRSAQPCVLDEWSLLLSRPAIVFLAAQGVVSAGAALPAGMWEAP